MYSDKIEREKSQRLRILITHTKNHYNVCVKKNLYFTGSGQEAHNYDYVF